MFAFLRGAFSGHGLSTYARPVPRTSPLLLIATVCLAETLAMLGVFAFPALLPTFIAEWHLSNTQAGWINGIYFAGYVAAVPVLGSLTDRIDGRRILLISMLGSSAAAFAYGILAEGFWSALALRATAGACLAGTFIPGLRTLVDRLDGAYQERAVSLYTATFSLGGAASFFVTGRLAAEHGWQAAFACGGATSLLAALLIAGMLGPHAPTHAVVDDTHWLDLRAAVRDRRTRTYILAYAAHMWELFGVRSWMVAFLTFSLAQSRNSEAAWRPATVAALTGVIAMGASLAGAELAMRFGRARVIRVVMTMSALAASSIGFAANLPYATVAVLCALYLLLVQGESAALHNGVVLSAAPARRGAAMAVQSIVGFTSAVLAPLAFGVVLDATGKGATAGSWGLAFMTLGIGVACGPLALRGDTTRSPAPS